MPGSKMQSEPHRELPAIRDHRRQWKRCLYVYPVISRRAEGLSIGVNLNPAKDCNFSCLYCQIDRRVPRGLEEVNMSTLAEELREAFRKIDSGEIWRESRFAEVPQKLRRVNDIALSGDGEPTCLPNFDEAVAAAAAAKDEFCRDDVKIVTITNASQLDQPQVQRALPILDSNNGEIWAKLDAGSEDFFQRVNRPQPRISLQRIVDSIISVAKARPVVIQSLFFLIDRAPPLREEIDAYCRRLSDIVDAGGKIKLVQIHTIARSPQDSSATALADAELDRIADTVRAIAPTPVEVYYGANVAPQQQS